MKISGLSEMYTGPDGMALIICPPSFDGNNIFLEPQVLFSWDGDRYRELSCVDTTTYGGCFRKLRCASPFGPEIVVEMCEGVEREPTSVYVNGQPYTPAHCPEEVTLIPRPQSRGSRSHLRPAKRSFALAAGPPSSS